MTQGEQAGERRRGAVLIVSGDADDRDRLCAVLDALEFDAIYAVADVVQARLVLGQIARLNLVLLALSGDDRVAATFCTELRQAAPLDPPAILALIRADALASASGRGYLSGGLVTDWIASPVVAEEALARIASVLDGQVAHAASPLVAVGERYRFAFDDSHEELLIVDVESGRVVDANPAFLLRSGHARVQVVGARAEAFDGFPSVESRLESLNRLAGEGRARFAGYRQRADASRYPVDAEVHLALSAGRPVHVYTFRDPGDLGRYRLAMSTLTAIHRTAGGELAVQQILRHAMDWLECDWGVVAMLCPESSEFTRVIAADDRALPFGLIESSDREPLLRLLVEGDDLLEGNEAWRVVPADSLLRARRYECLIGFPLRDERGGVLGAWLMARALPLEIDALIRDSLQIIATRIGLDLEIRQAREQGRARGLRDALTGLPNRLLFGDRLDSTLKQAHRTGESFALLFVELDPIHAGAAASPASSDRVLPVAAQRLRACVRGYDTVARYSGCEFVVILRHIVKREDALRIAEKIVRAMDAPVPVEDGPGHRIRTTIGLSFHPDDAIAADRLLLHAEEAMQAAKSMGHSNYQAYVLVPEESQRQRLALEQKLRKAERNGELRVYYQPQIDGRTEDIVGMEALIRWENPELGMISPGFFIPLAEQTGLIVSLGQWVLRAACADARRWQARFDLPLRVSVNLSALQLRQADLVERIAAILAETGLDPRSLDLEVTESISLKAIPNLLDTLQALREIGCRTSIDDFGTGQSSLDYIKRFPADSIKIDQAFVRNIGVDPDDEAIVRATIDMAHSLGRSLVAEGVEVERHVDFLRAHGCDVLQGYLFCRPVPAPAFEAMLLERERVFRRIAEPSGAS
ncbi:MAG TPA: bifunctional diguanylate cyclase/phosphodiesterase [Dokdonella sp.]|uniref:putative bifunctional diguanylate cyclase/phosphodiesterase n=1 Tax=Dokdonella sp. TaxID=2291710 RepID=UPI002B7CBDDE|nr:bifunctional diguanylate cyclase/phosphodiesterase [Dokdonella sp.]HUD43271.1 bifunctional diguanylate cyclase/phosphodiesterase [Dokdonella sp.]